MRKVASFFLILSLFTFGMITTQATINPTPVYAANDDLSSVVDNIQNSSSVLGDEPKNKVTGIFKDTQSIVCIVVIGVMSITTLLTGLKFHNVGDNPNMKSILKTALTFEIMGIIFVASYLGMIRFGLKNFNLFSK